MKRRDFLRLTAVCSAAGLTSPALANAKAERSAASRAGKVRPFELDELTISELQAGLASGKYSAVSLAKKYLARIEDIDRRGPTLKAVIELNPDAPAIAAARDKERKANEARGPLHGIPILIKDNIATHDRMTTTAGSV